MSTDISKTQTYRARSLKAGLLLLLLWAGIAAGGFTLGGCVHPCDETDQYGDCIDP
jgi:hypothetical protein